MKLFFNHGRAQWDVTWAEFLDLDPAERLWFYLMLADSASHLLHNFDPDLGLTFLNERWS
jgi:hypothetical protein